MRSIPPYSGSFFSFFNNIIAEAELAFTISTIYSRCIELISPFSVPFNAIVQFGSTTTDILQGMTATICKKKQESPVSQSEPNYELFKLSEDTSTIFPPNTFSTDGMPIVALPQEITLTILSYLDANDLGRSLQVNKKWYNAASNTSLWNDLDLRKLSPSLKVFDESDWITHVGVSACEFDVSDALPINNRTAIPALKKLIASSHIEANAGITLLTIPKGLTINKIINFAKARNLVDYYWNPISSELGDIPVDQTYKIVITNNILVETRQLSSQAQKEFTQKIGYRMPKVLEATVLLVVTFMCSNKRLYNDNPWTYTRCMERVANHPLYIGGFSWKGFKLECCFDFGSEVSGVGGVLMEFVSIRTTNTQ